MDLDGFGWISLVGGPRIYHERVAGKRMGRPPITEHGTRAMYAKGCHCPDCRQAESEYARARRIGQSAPTTLAAVPSVPPPEPGKAELAIAQEIGSIPTASGHPGLVEVALRLARDLDNEGLAATHSSLSRELRAVIENLHQGVRSSGKLAALSAMSDRRKPSGTDG
jgi:hypothetical protein